MGHALYDTGLERARSHRQRAAMLLAQMEASRDEKLRVMLLQMALKHFRLALAEELRQQP